MDFANGKRYGEWVFGGLAVVEAFISEQLAVSREQMLGTDLVLP
jgi:hypothetical protein